MGLSARADQIPDESRVAAGIDYGGDHRPLRFDKILDGQVALRDERASVVVELDRENFWILGDPFCDGEVAIQEFVAAGRAAGGEIILRGLNVVTDTVERDDGQSVHFCRRMPRLSSAIVSVCISPRV